MKFDNFKDMITDKDNWVMVGKKAGQLSKVIVVEGIKAVALKGTAKVVTTSFDEGLSGVKKLKFDEVVGITNDDTPKKKLFSRKNKKDAIEEILEEVVEEPVEWTKYEKDIDPEPVENK